MGKVEENKLHKRNSLLQTAFDLFTTKGVGKTSISDIVANAGVAKGTFYLYFKDKIDIKNKLIVHKTQKLFEKPLEALKQSPQPTFSDKVIFVIDNIIDQLSENPTLLLFISKNLSWGIFKKAIIPGNESNEYGTINIYDLIISEDGYRLTDPEIMLYLIIELVGSALYSSILYNEPVPIQTLKPYMYNSIRLIIKQHETDILEAI